MKMIHNIEWWINDGWKTGSLFAYYNRTGSMPANFEQTYNLLSDDADAKKEDKAHTNSSLSTNSRFPLFNNAFIVRTYLLLRFAKQKAE
jgi:hypothetical protein